VTGGKTERLEPGRRVAPVLVLDEPTAHLDPPTAERLMDDVLDAAGDRSVLLITHRSEGLDRMDEIVTLPHRRRPTVTR
jgi:ABC-type transport system involved in cytochrome bd biosynthesis fused ATPase/permease subunit